MTSPKESAAPGTVTAGYWLVVVGSALSVLAGIYLLLNKQTVIDAVKKASTDPKVTPETIETTTTVSLIVTLAITVVVAGLAVWLVGKVRAGRKKSRTGLMVTLLLGLFFQLIANPLAVVAALVAVCGLVLLYFRQSTEYLTEAEPSL